MAATPHRQAICIVIKTKGLQIGQMKEGSRIAHALQNEAVKKPSEIQSCKKIVCRKLAA